MSYHRFYLGIRVAKYMVENGNELEMTNVNRVLRSIADGELTLNDPSEQALQMPQLASYAVWVGNNSIRSDRQTASELIEEFCRPDNEQADAD
ncbi:hypothetical protein [Lacunimicrobium album]